MTPQKTLRLRMHASPRRFLLAALVVLSVFAGVVPSTASASFIHPERDPGSRKWIIVNNNPLTYTDPTGLKTYLVTRFGQVSGYNRSTSGAQVAQIALNAAQQNARLGNQRANENLGHTFLIVRDSPAARFLAVDFYPGANRSGRGNPDVGLREVTAPLNEDYVEKINEGTMRAIQIPATADQERALVEQMRQFGASDVPFGDTGSSVNLCSDPVLQSFRGAHVPIEDLGETQVLGRTIKLNRIPRFLFESLLRRPGVREVSIDEALDPVH